VDSTAAGPPARYHPPPPRRATPSAARALACPAGDASAATLAPTDGTTGVWRIETCRNCGMDVVWVWLFRSEHRRRGAGGARDAPDRVPAPGEACLLTTTMEHRGCSDHGDAPSSWLGRPGTGPGLGTGDAGVTGEACSCRLAARRAGYQPAGSAGRAPAFAPKELRPSLLKSRAHVAIIRFAQSLQTSAGYFSIKLPVILLCQIASASVLLVHVVISDRIRCTRDP
jgi:hypothetical protein